MNKNGSTEHENLIRKEMEKLSEYDYSDHAKLISRSVIPKLVSILSESENGSATLSVDNQTYNVKFVEYVKTLADGNDGVFDELPSPDDASKISSLHVIVSENNGKDVTDVQFRNDVVECTPARIRKFPLRLQLAIINKQ
jgi:hypothetical protein